MKTDGGALKGDQNGQSVDDRESGLEPKKSEMMDEWVEWVELIKWIQPMTKNKESILM